MNMSTNTRIFSLAHKTHPKGKQKLTKDRQKGG